jgi:GNAT superfamily N-acetyltransferase
MSETDKFQIREIDEKWNEQMLSIVEQSPIEANGMKIIFDRHPDIFFILRQKSEALQCIGFFLGEKLEGFAIMLHRKVLVNGTSRMVKYFGYLVVSPSARGRGFISRISDYFFSDPLEKSRYGYSVIMSGNQAALKLLNRFHPKYPNMPHSKMIAYWQVQNIFLTFRIYHDSRYTIRHAELSDIDAIVQLLKDEYKRRLFGSVVTRETIMHFLSVLPDFEIGNYYIAESGKEIVGVCCAWDMTQVKKNRVVEYSPKLKRTRFLVNAFSFLLNFPRLPSEGEAFRDVSITEYAVKNRDPIILSALLNKIHHEYRKRKYHLMIFGCPSDDPIKKATRHFVSRSVISQIHIFSGSKDTIERFENENLPWIDMALL